MIKNVLDNRYNDIQRYTGRDGKIWSDLVGVPQRTNRWEIKRIEAKKIAEHMDSIRKETLGVIDDLFSINTTEVLFISELR